MAWKKYVILIIKSGVSKRKKTIWSSIHHWPSKSQQA